jgi:hypothetical protein
VQGFVLSSLGLWWFLVLFYHDLRASHRNTEIFKKVLDIVHIIANTSNQQKNADSGGVSVAGNSNSGKSIAFRMSEKELEKKIQKFRDEYGDGQHGMVSWPLFCDFIGYSIDEVAECYQKGRSGENAYSGRALLLERFNTAVAAMTLKTSNKQQNMANKEVERDYLNPKVGDLDKGTTICVMFGVKDDDRWIEAMK